MADPLILDLNREYVLKYRPKPTPRPIELIRMMKPSSQAKYLPPPPIAGLAEDSSLHDSSEELDEPVQQQQQPEQRQPSVSKEETSPGPMSYDEYRLMKHKEKQQKKMERR